MRLLSIMAVMLLLFALGCSPPEESQEEPQKQATEQEAPEGEEDVQEESPEYVAFLIDHTARVFQAAELEGQEERDALKELAEEYLAWDNVPGELEPVHELYSEAMQFYAQGEDDIEAATDAFMKMAEAIEELEKHVDLDDYE